MEGGLAEGHANVWKVADGTANGKVGGGTGGTIWVRTRVMGQDRTGALALLKALPESIKVRAGVDEVHGIDCNLIGNFPHLSAWRFGGANSETLAERGGEVGNSLRTWRRACASGRTEYVGAGCNPTWGIFGQICGGVGKNICGGGI